ncbi:MAG: hypothetical protein KGY74_07670 [Candidatus Cloacimonetes bacterium]|nr:hypothetical protein [Candidatus Cloacimonadota bacterium]
MIVIAFYTKNYEKYANNLRNQLEDLGIKNDIVEVGLEEYMKERPESCNKKHWITRSAPMFIKQMYERYPDEDLFYIHADAAVRKNIRFTIEKDDAVLVSEGCGIPIWMKPKNLKTDVIGAPLFIRHCQRSEIFLEDYLKKVRDDDRNVGEQVILSEVVQDVGEVVKINYFRERVAVNALKIPVELNIMGQAVRFSIITQNAVQYFDPMVVV